MKTSERHIMTINRNWQTRDRELRERLIDWQTLRTQALADMHERLDRMSDDTLTRSREAAINECNALPIIGLVVFGIGLGVAVVRWLR